MKKILVLAGVLGTLGAVPLAAEEIAAPRIDTAAVGSLRFGGLAIYVTPQRHGGDGAAPALREAGPAADPYAGFTEANPAVRAYLGGPSPFYAAFEAVAGADGRVSACRLADRNPPPYDPAVLCRGLEQGLRILPALDEGGNRVSAPVRISFFATYQLEKQGGGAPALFGAVSLVPPPAPPPPPPQANIGEDSWPPMVSWLTARSAAFTTRAALAENAAVVGAPVGLVYGDKAADWPGCHIVTSSGDAARDTAACAYVAKKLKPQWADGEDPGKRHAALLVAPGKTPSAFAARRELVVYPRMLPDSAAALVAGVGAIVGPQPAAWAERFAMVFTLDANGRVAHCRISTSSGDDARDTAACRLAREQGALTTPRDSFGRARSGTTFYWDSVIQGVRAKP